MNEAYLEVTFRRGRAVAAYYYLPRKPGEKSQRTRRLAPGLVVDLGRGGHPIGIEITAPSRITVAALNRALTKLGLSRVTRSDLGPLLAA